MKPHLKEQHDAALKFVNNIRKEFGDSPIDEIQPGRRAMASKCPIARSFEQNCVVNLEHIAFYEGTRLIRRIHSIPFKVKNFIYSFDMGLYPGLILEHEEEEEED